MSTRPASLCQLANTWSGAMPIGGLPFEEKIDGWRALWLRDHMGNARLFTRNGMPIEGVGHIAYRLEQMERAAGMPMVFDGEFQVDGTLDATKAWCESRWRMGGEAGQFFAFDCMPLSEWQKGEWGLHQHDRRRILEELAAAAVDGWDWRPGSRGRDETAPPAIVVLEEGWAFDQADVLNEARRVWARGGEGLMLKDPMAPYRRYRGEAWLKVKRDGAGVRKAA